MTPKTPVAKAEPFGKNTMQFVTRSTTITSAVEMSTFVWKLTPIIATTDIKDEDECGIVSTDDDDINMTEEKIGNLLKTLPQKKKVMINDFSPI